MLRRKTFALAVGLLLLSPGCSSSLATAHRSHLPTDPLTVDNPGDPSITGAGYELNAAGEVSRAAADGAWAGALTTLNRYLRLGVLTPLRSGGPAGPLAPYFTAEAGRLVSAPGTDRAAFVDEGLPPATAIRQDHAVATLAGLAGPDGVVVVVTARLDLQVTVEVEGAPVTIARTGELVLVPEGGRWKIDAFDISVKRDSAEVRTTTTARSS